MEKNILLQYLRCPLTKLLFSDPVIAEDGNFYEYLAIKNHLDGCEKSPVNPSEKMGNILSRSTVIKNMVEKFILDNPEYKGEQFLFKKPYSLFSHEFTNLIKTKQFDKIEEFTSIILNSEICGETIFETICKNCPDKIIKYVIDNSIDYDSFDKKNLKPIHIVCKYCSPEIITHLVQKGVDLECEDINGERPLFYLMIYKNDKKYRKFIKLYLNYGVDVNHVNNFGIGPVQMAIVNGDIEMFTEFIIHGYVLVNDAKFMQYIFTNSRGYEFIEYYIKLVMYGNNIDDLSKSEHAIYRNNNLTKKQKQQLVFKYLTIIFNKPIVVDNYVDMKC